jgi:hypothetical protein
MQGVSQVAARGKTDTSVATDVYWLLPGMRSFIDSVSVGIHDYRWLHIDLPSTQVTGLRTALEVALARAHLDHQQVRWVKLSDGMDVAGEIGTVLGSRALVPEELAIAESKVRTIVLDPKAPSAARQCAAYLEAFRCAVTGTERVPGQPSLLVLLPSPPGSHEIPRVQDTRHLVFTGALTPQEMQAYVALRMSDRNGPGDTGLFRSLVSEFAGIDAGLAEQLIGWTDEELLGLPRSLEALAAGSDDRWRRGRWADGCYVELKGRRLRHVLYELNLSQNAGPEQRDAMDWLHRRYWRACLRSLLPWMEERRAAVMEILRGALEQHLRRQGGKAVRVLPNGTRIETPIEDLEYNQIPGLVLQENFRVVGQPRSQLAIDVCFAAKRVRDRMAHMKVPEPAMILDLTHQMGLLLPD